MASIPYTRNNRKDARVGVFSKRVRPEIVSECQVNSKRAFRNGNSAHTDPQRCKKREGGGGRQEQPPKCRYRPCQVHWSLTTPPSPSSFTSHPIQSSSSSNTAEHNNSNGNNDDDDLGNHFGNREQRELTISIPLEGEPALLTKASAMPPSPLNFSFLRLLLLLLLPSPTNNINTMWFRY